VIGLESSELHSIIQNILEAFNKKDLTRMLSFFADDLIFVRPEGTFKGKEEIKRFYTWMYSNYSEIRFAEKDFIVEGNKAVVELVSEGTSARGGNKKQRIQALTLFEFRNGKVQQVNDYYNQLLIAQQLANGWFEKTIVNAVVNRMHRGLR
jgi:steroid delta-isomerase-like uncharacterized protein